MPILGSFREFLAGRWYETFTKWQKLYGTHVSSTYAPIYSHIVVLSIGDIVYAPVPGQSIYIINSYQLAEEALRKSRFSSGRAYSRMLNHL